MPLDSETRALLDDERRQRLVNQIVEDMETGARLLTALKERVAAHQTSCCQLTAPTVAIEDLCARTRAVLSQVSLHECAVRRVIPARRR